MTRICWAVAALIATAAASPLRPLPVPPIPPANPPTDQTAPMPDRDIRAPSEPSTEGARVDLRDFRVHRFNQGLGYAPGSQYETSEEKRPIQTPGLTVRVPLQQR
jgi:hypothetical protein